MHIRFNRSSHLHQGKSHLNQKKAELFGNSLMAAEIRHSQGENTEVLSTVQNEEL